MSGQEQRMQKNISARRFAAAGIAFALAALICAAVYANGTLPLALDEAVRDFFISIRNNFTDIAVIGLTHLGDTVTIVALCIVLLILPNRKTYGLPVSLAALAGVAVYKPMKHLFLRARPDELLHLVEQGGYSFPSGHSVSSVIVYGLLLYLIRRHCQSETLRRVLTVACSILALLIGPSRLYVSVHWASDVACGMLIGLGVLLIAINIMERIDEKNGNRQGL